MPMGTSNLNPEILENACIALNLTMCLQIHHSLNLVVKPSRRIQYFSLGYPLEPSFELILTDHIFKEATSSLSVGGVYAKHLFIIVSAVSQEWNQLVSSSLFSEGDSNGLEPTHAVETQFRVLIFELISASES